MIVVADSGPLRYLVLIGHIEVLPVLYKRVLIPPAVEQELSHRRTPAAVNAWMAAHPSWLEVHPVTQSTLPGLSDDVDIGEEQAIILAQEMSARYILMDDRAGRIAAQQLDLQVIGTLGVLQQAAAAGLLNFASALAELESTNFRISSRLRRLMITGHEN